MPEEQKGVWPSPGSAVFDQSAPPPPLPDDGAEGPSFSASFRDLVQRMAGDGESRAVGRRAAPHNWLEEAGRDVGDLTPWLVREDEE